MNKLFNEDCLTALKDNSIDVMKSMDQLQIGKAGEYLVCADLILKGFIAFPSEQGLPFDVVLSTNDRLYKIQVKTTRGLMPVPQRTKRTDKYLFYVKRCGKGGTKEYRYKDVDIFALVALDTKMIGYVTPDEVKSTIHFLPETGIIVKKNRCKCKKLSEYKIEQCL